MNEDRLSSTGLRRFCKYVDELGSRANGAIALHTAYIDFDLYCPNRGIHPQYINLVRDPIDRLISGTKYVMSCVCKQHQRAEHQADGAPAGKVWCSKHTQEMTQHGADPCNSTVNDVLANRLLDGHGKAKPEGADVTLYRGYFCGHWNKCQNSADPLERVRLAKHVLSTAYSWVGILEAPTLSMQVLRTAVPMLKGIHELFHVAHKGDLHAQTNATGVATSGKEHHKKVLGGKPRHCPCDVHLWAPARGWRRSRRNRAKHVCQRAQETLRTVRTRAAREGLARPCAKAAPGTRASWLFTTSVHMTPNACVGPLLRRAQLDRAGSRKGTDRGRLRDLLARHRAPQGQDASRRKRRDQERAQGPRGEPAAGHEPVNPTAEAFNCNFIRFE